MTGKLSRRKFIVGTGAAAAALLPIRDLESGIWDPACEHRGPNPESRIPNPEAVAAFGIQFGYAAITWRGDDEQAIKDVSELGFRGIQLRANVLEKFGERPKELRELLRQHRLKMVAFSSGGVRIAPGTEAEELLKHTRNASFVREVGGLYLQVTDSALQRDRKPEVDDYKKLGRLLTEIGKRSHEHGIPTAYHNHMNSLGERPEEVDWIMDAADPRYVKLLLDIAHYQQGGGDPVKAIRNYKNRILLLHLKDVESPVPGATGDLSRSYRFVELGRGKVDLPAVVAALKEVNFNGWGVIELDAVPDPNRTPKESAMISKKYVAEKLGMKI
jgi:inosose dehydratase